VPRLLVIKGADEGKQFELADAPLGVGRDTQNTIRLHDTEVSRRHAEFALSDRGYTVRDVGSANGTFVNNQRIHDTVLLQAGDRIQIGQTTLIFSTGRGEGQKVESDLAEQINLISRADLDLSSAIIKTVAESEGSQILAHPDKAKAPWLRTALANLKIMYEASQAISHILDLDELLKRILELIFGSIPADRGCIMLRDGDNTAQYLPKAVFWRNPAEHVQKMPVSRTIIEHVLKAKEGVLVSNAAQDERFNTGQSIIRFSIQEVIAVPMKGRHETLGVLYLDIRAGTRELADRQTSLGKLTEEHLQLAIAIAHQAALAVEETRYHHALVHAERLAAVGETIAQMSHSIKNILQGLRSGGEILKMGLGEVSKLDLPKEKLTLLHQGWNILEKNQGKIYDLVMDMLSYSKERTPAIEETDLNDLVREVYELMSGRAKEMGVKFDISLEESIPLVQADPEGIHRALLNIVTNALDAVEERGNPPPQVIIGSRLDPQPGWVRLLVKDNGAGIAPDKLQDIFKPFVSSKGSKGTGLGLPVSRKILREHGGDIVVESQIGRGSRFTLRLPVKSPLSADMGASAVDQRLVPPEPEEN
jgi:signal transduction histidine kinase/pSer/pThr/pTyr-binding forkhead associated (FHA) protein